MDNIDKFLKNVGNKKVIKSNTEVSNYDEENEEVGEYSEEEWENDLSELEQYREESEYSNPEPGDVVLVDSGPLGSRVSASEVDGKFIGEFNNEDEALGAIKEFFSQNNAYGTIWYQDDHGGLTVVEGSSAVTANTDEEALLSEILDIGQDDDYISDRDLDDNLYEMRAFIDDFKNGNPSVWKMIYPKYRKRVAEFLHTQVPATVEGSSAVTANTDTSDSYASSNSTTNNTIHSTTTEEALLSEILDVNQDDDYISDRDLDDNLYEMRAFIDDFKNGNPSVWKMIYPKYRKRVAEFLHAQVPANIPE